jgi:hypothetical protein
MPEKPDQNSEFADSGAPQAGWPSWFIQPVHPLEREVLFSALQSNERLREVQFVVSTMQMNYLVFLRNYEDLLRLHQDFDKPATFRELALETDRGQEIAQNAILDFTRLLHNYLASERMLVDVTRRWVRKHFAETSFLATYEAEVVRRFASNVQAQFLGDLRNFTLHRTLPLTIPELRMEKVSEERLRSSLGIVLLKDYLLDWDNWSELGRMQIEMAFEGQVDIVTICSQYSNNVTEFNQWLFWQVRDLFGNEIDQINAVIERIRDV